ncbi:MAG: hypothetical protein M5U12_11605, partial [Verrucomicrobia bacterium]|nr:hypothetical protein [Verrucomicrobiota bacterium]
GTSRPRPRGTEFNLEQQRTMNATVPETIRTIIAQAGGQRISGAFAYVGARKLTYRCARLEGEFRSSRDSRLRTDLAMPFVDYEVGLQFQVNGKRGRVWTMIVAYEPNDTYTAWLVEGRRRRGQLGLKELACARDVYCDTLKGVIEAVYDRAIRDHNDGFIPM